MTVFSPNPTWDQLLEERRGMLQYEFERTPEGHLAVHGTNSCGRSFRGIAHILEPDSPNPVLHLAKPLGFNAVKEIIAHHESLKKGGGTLN